MIKQIIQTNLQKNMNPYERNAFESGSEKQHEADPEMTGLPNALKNRLTEIIKRYEIKTHDIGSMLESVKIKKFDIYQMTEVSKGTPKVLSALIGKDYGFSEIENSDLPDAIKCIAEHIGGKESFEDVTISIGMGGSVDMPNVRIPAYIMPAIKSLKSMVELMEKGEIKGVPRVRVFKADHMASLVNNFDSQRVHDVTGLTFKFLQDFIGKFYPQLAQYFRFDTDAELSSENLNEFKKKAEFLYSSPQMEEEVTSVTKMGGKHGGEEGVKNALLYAAAHPYYNQSIIRREKTGHINEGVDVPKMIIDHGGRPQKIFNKIARSLIHEVKNNDEYLTPPTIHMIIKAGKIPVYYAARDGDIPVGVDVNSIDYKKIDRSTHMDYKEIFSDVEEHKFIQFVNEFNQENKDVIKQVQETEAQKREPQVN